MNSHFENEAKALLKKEDYLKLLPFFLAKPYIQTNYYFDTKDFVLRNLGYSLRIRFKENTYELTLKEKIDKIHKETNINISKKEAIDIINLKQPIVNYLKCLLPKKVWDCGIVLLGSLQTERIDLQYNGSLLSLDKNTYSSTSDFEIECESSSYEKACNALDEFLKEKGVDAPLTTLSKTARALKSI